MWLRALCAIVPGFLLAAGLVGLVSWALPGPWQAALVPGLVALFPVWMVVAAAAFGFASAARAAAWLSGAAASSLALLWLLQWLQWVR